MKKVPNENGMHSMYEGSVEGVTGKRTTKQYSLFRSHLLRTLWIKGEGERKKDSLRASSNHSKL